MGKAFGKRIRKHREARKLTQEQISEYCSVSPSVVSRWENGSTNPNKNHRRQLSDILKIDLDSDEPTSCSESAYSSTMNDIIEILNRMSDREQELILNILIDIDTHLGNTKE